LENPYLSFGEVLLYKISDGTASVEVPFHTETLWMSLVQMAELFQKDKSTISKHIKNIFNEEELVKNSVVANYATTASDGKTYQVKYYSGKLKKTQKTLMQIRQSSYGR